MIPIAASSVEQADERQVATALMKLSDPQRQATSAELQEVKVVEVAMHCKTLLGGKTSVS